MEYAVVRNVHDAGDDGRLLGDRLAHHHSPYAGNGDGAAMVVAQP